MPHVTGQAIIRSRCFVSEAAELGFGGQLRSEVAGGISAHQYARCDRPARQNVNMALTIDTSRQLRTHAQLSALVSAVRAANPEDESRAVEWKSGYEDVTATDAAFAIARAILGLANRPVAVAARDFKGVGFVLVGVEPGALRGQRVPDSARLTAAIARYTGHGLAWDHRTIRTGDVEVLIVTVEPPRDGDRIATLQKDHQGPKLYTPAGTIFVRRPGATERASLAEIEMLQDRLLAGAKDGAASTQAEQDRELRTLTGDMVSAAHLWHSSIQLMILASASPSFTSNTMLNWTNTDTGREAAAAAKTMRDRGRRIRLLSNDAAVLAAVATAEDHFSGVATFTGTPLSGKGDDESRADAYKAINQMLNAYDNIERVVSEAVAR